MKSRAAALFVVAVAFVVWVRAGHAQTDAKPLAFEVASVTATGGFTLIRWAGAGFVVTTGLAMFLYPGGTLRDHSTRGYSFFQNFLSDLGNTVAWSGASNRASAALFAFGLAGLILALGACFVALVKLHSESRSQRYLARAAGLAVAVSLLSALAVVLTPSNLFLWLHLKSAALAIRSFPLASLLLTVVAARDTRFSRRAVFLWLVLTVVFLAYALVIQEIPLSAQITRRALMIQVGTQKLAFVALLVTFVLQSYEAEQVLGKASS